MMRNLSLVFGIILMFSNAEALTVFDEAIDGDAENSLPGTSIGTLSLGRNSIIGTLDGGPVAEAGPDELDSYNFFAPSPFTLVLFQLDGVAPVGFVFDKDLNRIQSGRLDPNGQTLNIFEPGLHFLSVVPSRNSNFAEYRAEINLIPQVPTPPSLILLITSIGFLFAMFQKNGWGLFAPKPPRIFSER